MMAGLSAPWGGILALLELGALAFLAAGIGRRLAAGWLPDADPEQLSVLALPLGLGLLIQGSTALLFAGLARAWVVLLLLGTAALLCRRDLAAVAAGLRDYVRRLGSARGAERLLAVLCGAVGLLGVAGALAPETGWDAGVYHFAMASLRAEEGGMVVRPDLPPGYRPGALQSLQALGFLLNGEALASLFNIVLYFAGFSLTRHLGSQAGGPRAGLLAGFAYLTSVTFILRTSGGDVEMGQAVYFGVTVVALDRLRKAGSWRWAALAGFGVGMMLSIKTASAWIVLSLAVCAAVLRVLDRSGGRRTLSELAVVGAVAALLTLPWYVRNWIVAGHPLYPQQGYLATALAGREGGWVWLPELIRRLPLDGLILLSIPAMAAGSAGRLRPWGAAGILGVCLFVRHLGSFPGSATSALRYGSPSFVALLALAAVGLEAAWRRGPVLRWGAIAVLALGAAGSLGIHAVRSVPKIPAAAGLVSRDDYLDSRINSYWAIRKAEAQLPPGKRILLAEVRAYYCRAPYLGVSDLQDQVRFEDLRTPEALGAFLESRNIAFIVHNHSPEARTWGFKGIASTPGLLDAAGAALVETRRDCSLYRVR